MKKIVSNKEKENLFTTPSVSLITWILIGVCLIPLVSSSVPEPSIEIIKTGPIFAYVGDSITYMYYVSNPEHQPLSDVSVIDDQCGVATYVSGDSNKNNKLDHGEIWTYICNTTPVFDFPHPLTNTATATGTWNKQTAEATDSYTLYPFIVRKDVLLDWDGENIDYDDPDTLFTIQILKDDDILGTFSINESIPKYLWLSSGTYHLTEINIPDGYLSFYETITITAGDDYLDFSFINIFSSEEIIEPEEPEEPEQPEEPTEPEEPEQPEEPEIPEEPEKPIQPKRRSHGIGYGNIAPIANANGPYSAIHNEEITFNASHSYDPDGIIIHYRWSFGDGSHAEGITVTHNYTHVGIYQVMLTVIDNFGVVDTDVTNATIIIPNRPPAYPIIGGPTNGLKNTDYSYVIGSIDEDHDDINYLIDWGDGNDYQTIYLQSGTYLVYPHRWDEPGTYTITVTASDGLLTATSVKNIIIHETLITDNIAIIALAILALIALIASILYSKKDKNKK